VYAEESSSKLWYQKNVIVINVHVKHIEVMCWVVVQVEELVRDLEERLRNHNIFTVPRVNQRVPDATMTQNQLILKVPPVACHISFICAFACYGGSRFHMVLMVVWHAHFSKFFFACWIYVGYVSVAQWLGCWTCD